VTGRHRGPRRKLRAGYRAPSGILGVLCAVTHIFPHWTSAVSVTHVIFTTVECGIARFICAMRVFDVLASSSPARLPLCKVSFAASVAELTRGKNRVLNQSMNHTLSHSFNYPTYLMSREPKLSLRNK